MEDTKEKRMVAILTVWPSLALQRTRLVRRGCNPRVPCAGSLSLGRWAVPCKAKGNEQQKKFVNFDVVRFENEKGNQWQNFTHLGLKYL
jgi:hypothetical protein